MPPTRRAPQSLKIVAYSFLIEGFLWMALMIASAMSGGLWLNPLVFVALIGWGLLKCSPSAYRWALSYLFALIFGGVLLVFEFDRFFRGAIWGRTLIGLFIVLKLWQIRVLFSPPVRRAFSLRDED